MASVTGSATRVTRSTTVVGFGGGLVPWFPAGGSPRKMAFTRALTESHPKEVQGANLGSRAASVRALLRHEGVAMRQQLHSPAACRIPAPLCRKNSLVHRIPTRHLL